MYAREKSEIQILKSYLLDTVPTTPLPPNDILLSSNSVALKAAIAGLDKELGRLEREERLLKKFTATGSGDKSAAATTGVRDDDDADDMEFVTKEDAAVTDDVAMGDVRKGTADDEEWEEAEASPAKKQQRQQDDDEEICQKLASSAVSRIASANIKVATPLGALGLILHTWLLELPDDKNGDPIFKCTGVPDGDVISQFLGLSRKAKRGGVGGFALPIRELPKGDLVPLKWEDQANSEEQTVIAFRYKCGKEVYSTDMMGPTNDATTVYLALQILPGSEVAVSFGTLPASSSMAKSEERQQLQFPLGEHVNLDGLAAAKEKSLGGSVLPSLFYISLSKLLMNFSSTFGVLQSKKAMQVVCEYPNSLTSVVGQTTMPPVMPSGNTGTTSNLDSTRVNAPPDGVAVDMNDPLLVMNSQRRRNHGDFEGDLLPGGPQPGGLQGLPPHGGGNQVGPDHPIFDQSFGDDDGYSDYATGPPSFSVPGVGGMEMRPRFDPYGPPGGPTEPGRGGGRFPGRGSRLGRGRGRGSMPPGGFGDPNPNHLPPPGDYYS